MTTCLSITCYLHSFTEKRLIECYRIEEGIFFYTHELICWQLYSVILVVFCLYGSLQFKYVCCLELFMILILFLCASLQGLAEVVWENHGELWQQLFSYSTACLPGGSVSIQSSNNYVNLFQTDLSWLWFWFEHDIPLNTSTADR